MDLSVGPRGRGRTEAIADAASPRRPGLRVLESDFEPRGSQAKEADMNANLAYAALVGAALAGSTALAQQASGPANQPAQTQKQPAQTQNQPAQTQSSQAAPSGGQFIDTQALDEWRAPKLVGVDVYGPDNKKIGKIQDILMTHDGMARAVVIGVGGFLGIGEKDVAVPFQSVQWRTEGRTVPIQSQMPPSAPLASSGGAQPAPPPPMKTNPAATEASQGYPDKAVIDMTLAQLKSAPDFHYARNPVAEAESGSQSAATPRPQPQKSTP
jgi:sporulation protein YlmC with PRC-barrel domain